MIRLFKLRLYYSVQWVSNYFISANLHKGIVMHITECTDQANLTTMFLKFVGDVPTTYPLDRLFSIELKLNIVKLA